MTNTERLIEIAIENGWVPQYQRDRLTKYEIEAGSYKEMQAHIDLKKDYVTQGAFLDPLFFQAVGRGLGWKQIYSTEFPYVQYVYEWHRLIDHLAEGHSIEDYAGKLLSK